MTYKELPCIISNYHTLFFFFCVFFLFFFLLFVCLIICVSLTHIFPVLRELYFAIVMDRAAGGPALVASTQVANLSDFFFFFFFL